MEHRPAVLGGVPRGARRPDSWTWRSASSRSVRGAPSTRAARARIARSHAQLGSRRLPRGECAARDFDLVVFQASCWSGEDDAEIARLFREAHRDGLPSLAMDPVLRGARTEFDR